MVACGRRLADVKRFGPDPWPRMSSAHKQAGSADMSEGREGETVSAGMREDFKVQLASGWLDGAPDEESTAACAHSVYASVARGSIGCGRMLRRVVLALVSPRGDESQFHVVDDWSFWRRGGSRWRSAVSLSDIRWHTHGSHAHPAQHPPSNPPSSPPPPPPPQHTTHRTHHTPRTRMEHKQNHPAGVPSLPSWQHQGTR